MDEHFKGLEEEGLLFFRDIEAPLKSGTVSHFEICWYKNDIQNAKENLRKIISEDYRNKLQYCMENIMIEQLK